MSDSVGPRVSEPSRRSDARIPVLDGWRGVAIFVVVLHNAGLIGYSLGGEPSLAIALTNTVLASGWVGVQLFFVLSGFLITGILVDSRGTQGYYRSFYLRRTLRIFPVYYLFLVLAVFVAPAFASDPAWVEAVREDQIWFWLYLSNWKPLLTHGPDGFGHLWSLAVEEQFYLIWPLLVAVSGRRFVWVVLAVVVGAPLSRAAMLGAGMEPDYLYYFTNARADALALGALMALAVRDETWHRAALRLTRPVFLLSSVGLVAVVLTSEGLPQGRPHVLLYGQSLIALWFGALMLLSMHPTRTADRMLARELERPWLRTLGKYSYTMYVVHYPLSQYLVPRLAPLAGEQRAGVRLVLTLAYGLVILALSAGLARLSWLMLERPLSRLKERIAPRAG